MRVEFYNPEYPEGTEMDVGGLLLINGESVEVSEDQLSFFEARNGDTLEAALSTVQFVTVDGKKYVEPEVKEEVVETTGEESLEEGDN